MINGIATYDIRLKQYSRDLRANCTEAEKLLWSHIRRKQILGVQFYRQKPIERFIVDFCASRPKIIIELDGSQHYEEELSYQDQQRDNHLIGLGFCVLRYSNFDVLKSISSVVQDIYNTIENKI